MVSVALGILFVPRMYRGFVYVLISALVGTQGIIQARASQQNATINFLHCRNSCVHFPSQKGRTLLMTEIVVACIGSGCTKREPKPDLRPSPPGQVLQRVDARAGRLEEQSGRGR